ncbi:HNH endonuclease [Streptomyces olindensis]|uniref:HNH endonuclease n=1 Tax=Streptomyces olindensis TaxID=358823 RepID=UPI003677D15A
MQPIRQGGGRQVLVGEYLNWTEGNPIVPYENPRRTRRTGTACAVHRWFEPGPLRCTYCGVSVYCTCGAAELEPGVIFRVRIADLPKRQATLDHLIPRSHGGKNDADNVAVACRSCNSSKQDLMFPAEWIPNRDLFTYIKSSESLPMLENISRIGRLISRVIHELDPEEFPPSVAEICAVHHWRPRDVHLALTEMHRAGAFCVFAHPCAPSTRYYRPIADPRDMFAGAVWVDGWS